MEEIDDKIEKDKNGHEASEPHACPFQSDIHNDDQFRCNCCDDCTKQCWMDR